MINALRIQNFKSLKDTGILRISPLTFFVGPNSSGKSSIIKAIVATHQTALTDDPEVPLQTEGKVLNLGSFQDFVYNHDERKKVQFDFEYDIKGSIRWSLKNRPGNLVRVDSNVLFSSKFVKGPQTKIVAQETTYLLNNFKNLQLTVSKNKLYGAGGYIGSARLGNEAVRYTPEKLTRFWNVEFATGRDKYTNISRSTEFEYNLTYILSALTMHFERLITNIFYIGPIRKEPLLIYSGRSEQPREVGALGEDALQALWVGRYNKKQRQIKNKVDYWMKEFGIAKTTKLRKYSSSLFQYYLTDLHTGIKSRLLDVGFGASQLLPLIVQGYLAPADSHILAEQPEIHLHPKAQGTLADMMIDIVSSKDKKIIAETHSGYLLMRLLTRIAQGEITNKDLSIYYFNPTESGTEVIPIDIDEKGRINSSTLPDGFFEEGFAESLEFSKALAESINGSQNK